MGTAELIIISQPAEYSFHRVFTWVFACAYLKPLAITDEGTEFESDVTVRTESLENLQPQIWSDNVLHSHPSGYNDWNSTTIPQWVEFHFFLLSYSANDIKPCALHGGVHGSKVTVQDSSDWQFQLSLESIQCSNCNCTACWSPPTPPSIFFTHYCLDSVVMSSY